MQESQSAQSAPTKKVLRPGRAAILFRFDDGIIEVNEAHGVIDQPLRDAIKVACKRFFEDYPQESPR